MRRSSGRRRLLIASAVAVGAATAITLSIIALYPHIGAWFVEHRVLPQVGKRLGCTISTDDIAVYRGGAELRDVVVTGPSDGEDPLARIGRVVVRFDPWSAVTGDLRLFAVEVQEASAQLVRHADGTDNFRAIAAKLGVGPGGTTDRGESAKPSRLGSLRPDSVLVTDASLHFRDEAGGITIAANAIDASGERDQPFRATVAGVSIVTDFGPAARVERMQVTLDPHDPLGTAAIEVRGGEIAAHRTISLSSISGTVSSSDEVGKLDIDLQGSYGGSGETLWSAHGWLNPVHNRASVHVEADRFTLGRLDSILRDSVVIDYQRTAIDAELDIAASEGRISLLGTFDLTDANVFHPMLAAKPVRDIDAHGKVNANFDTATRTLTLERGAFRVRGVEYQLTGVLYLPGGRDALTGVRREHPAVVAHLVIPPVPCQTMLEGIPDALMPYVTDYTLKGTFHTDLRVAIDWADLEATALDGSVGLFKCKVVQEPEDEAANLDRLLDTFTHYVEVEVDNWIEFAIGPENPDFVPIWDVSPHLLNSLMTTEDSQFYKHRGFIVREFRTALIKNLDAGYFRYGASSITMQTVKNVLLYREKTLSRKLQELFFTWHIENKLDKDRIFEIYLNAIEYGPGLYGVGPAARHYFGKHPRELNPVEAAFFSSILPNPKKRYKQYCDDTVWRWTEKKIARILGHMHRRGLLTDEDYEAAQNTQLVFDRTEAPPQRECRRMVKRAMENARPTNPMAK